MFTILNLTADSALGTAGFACDLGACKGACCTMKGGGGAPVADAEVAEIEAAIPVALEYLSERNRTIITRQGAVLRHEGSYETRCIDRRDCVFVYYENDVAKCAIERAYFDGKTSFRKPISCHLFPIRVEQYFGGPHLTYERISECKPAVTRGEAEGILVLDFLKEALVRAFGEEFYEALQKAARPDTEH